MTKQRATIWPLWIIIIFAVLVFVDIFIKLAVPISSNDLWWHIELGRQILDGGTLIPDHSIYTWSPSSAYHAYNSWLSDIILAFTDEVAGIAGLLLLRYCVVVSALLLAVNFVVKRRLHYHPLSWVIILLGFSLGGTSFLIKPELFSMGLFSLVIWLYFHIRSLGDRGCRLTYLFPIIMIVWVNTHGAFFVSSLFFASTMAGELINWRFSPNQAMSRRLRIHYFASMLLCIPALVVNPYGIELPLSIIDSLINQSAQDYGYIGAYQPTFILNKPPLFILEYLILAMVVFVILFWQKLKLRQADWVVMLSFVIFSALFTQMIRTTYFLAPVFIYSTLDLLSARTKSLLWPSNNAVKHAITIVTALIIAIMSWRIISYGRAIISNPISWFEDIQFVGNRYPQAEVDYINSHLKGRRIGNFYGDGGYLIYRLWPEKLVMIDPRYFPFKEWIDDYMKFSVEGQEIEGFVNSMDADYWLVNYDKKPLEWFGRSNNWSLAFFGPVAAIFIPTSDFNGKTTYSAKITEFTDLKNISKVLNAAVMLGEMALAKEIRLIAIKNIDSGFKYKEQFIQEIDYFLLGLQALSDQDLKKAANLFTQARSFSYGLTMSAKIYRYLASMAWHQRDYLKAREWSIAAYDVHNDKIFPDIYNLALTDWHVRHTTNSDLAIDREEIRWQECVDILIKRKDFISENLQSIVVTAEAMKKGVYMGDADLFQQRVYEENQVE
jgi:hypothetical protein